MTIACRWFMAAVSVVMAGWSGARADEAAKQKAPCLSAGHLGAEERDGRMIQKEAVVSASPAEVWRAWTTVEGVTGFGPPQAKVELRVGGAYEWYFLPDAPYGQRGSEGCVILSFLPERMLSFSWNAPPSVPVLRDAGARTQVVVEFEEVEPGKTRIRLTQHGMGRGEAWDAYYNYFDRVWPAVLRYVAASLEKSKADASTGTP